MPWFDHDDDRELLRRGVAALERIADVLERHFFPPPPTLTGVTLMALPSGPVAPGATGDFTATAVGADGVTPDANASVDVVSSDPAVFTVSGSSAGGVFTGTWTAVADGSATVTGTGTDGTDVVDTGAGNPASVSVATPPISAVNFG